MSTQPTLHIRQTAAGKDKHAIRLTLRRAGQPDLEGEATIRASAVSASSLRWRRPRCGTPRPWNGITVSSSPLPAIADLGVLHQAFGALYVELGQAEPAREHCERSIQYLEQVGNNYEAGCTRYNLAFMYLDAVDSARGGAPPRSVTPRRGLRDGQPAGLRFYHGRAADMEAKAQRLIEEIAGE